MSEFDLRALVRTLHEHEIRFVAIGGVAVGAHGFLRSTEDLDLVPDPDPANLTRLVEALAKLDSTLPAAGGRPFDPNGDAGVVRRGGNVTADTRFGGLDVVQRARGVPSFTQLVADAVESELFGIPVLVCSLAQLRGMKEAQGRAQDRADLENLPLE